MAKNTSDARNATTTNPAKKPSAMPILTFIAGAFLVVVGIASYALSSLPHFTAFIPSIIGALLLASGFLALKNLMAGIHIALLVAIAGAVGMFMPLQNLPAFFSGDAENPGAVVAALISLVVLVAYLALGVRSFIAARRWEKAK